MTDDLQEAVAKMNIARKNLVTKRIYRWTAKHPDANSGKTFTIYAKCCNASGMFLLGAVGISVGFYTDFASAHRRTDVKHGWQAYMLIDGKPAHVIGKTLKEVAFEISRYEIAYLKKNGWLI